MKQGIFLALFIFSNFSYAQSNSKISISYEKIPYDLATGLDKFKCKGSFGTPGLFTDIGYSDQDLKNGVTCRMADFDANGSADYWVYKCSSNLMTCNSKVIFMEKNSVKSVVPIGRNLDNPDVFYKGQKNDTLPTLKAFGCPLPKKDGLVEVGDGEGRENRVYEYNSTKKEFIEIGHCTSVEGDGE